MIAILLSTYNGGLYLREQIESFFSQTNQDWLLFVRDNGSKDNTIDILTEYTRKYPMKIQLVDDIKDNIGAGESFMHLLAVVDADYYMFSDQDDVWMSSKIDKTLSKLKELEMEYGTNVGIGVFTDLTVVDSELSMLMPSLWHGDNRDPKYIYDFYKQWTNRHASYGCTQMFNKAAKKLVLPYKQFKGIQGAHDNWVEYILIKKGKYDFLNAPTIYYRQHGKNVIGVNIGHSYYNDICDILKNPASLYHKIKKDYDRIKLMPFYISLVKVLWYRSYQSIGAIINNIAKH